MAILTKNKGIEDVLFEKKLLTSDQVSAINLEHLNTGKSIDQIIKERNFVSNNDYIKAFGEVYGIEYMPLEGRIIDPKLSELVSHNLAQKYNAAPFALDEVSKVISVAMVDPLDLQTIEFIERKTGYKVKPYISSLAEIEAVNEQQSGKAIGEEISAALEEISATTLKIEENQGDLTADEATLRDAPIARIVGMILETAVKTGASDVHIEPEETKTRLRYRVDGVLEEKRTLPREMHDSLVARIKILASMKIDEKRLPQDGRFKVEVGKTKTDLRVSTLPTVYGEKVVIRLLKEEGSVFSFRDLGIRGLSLSRLEEAIIKPVGMVLVTGPTGSGKTVTLASALSKLNTTKVNIVTIEDPVEIRIPGVNQVQVNPQAGLTFATGLRSFLRQDPNIIMVGEIRDGETAELAIHAALTGHLVLSTLHTNSAGGSIPRLLDMGVENFLLASTLNAVLAQRLVRKICVDCKEEYSPPPEIVDDIRRIVGKIQHSQILMSKDKTIVDAVKLGQGENLKVFRGKGCEKCGGTGYRGRTGIFEVMIMSDKIQTLTLGRSSESQIQTAAVEDGMLTLDQDGYLKVLEGITTIEEVLRVSKG
ncbi:hypothetical protein A2886_02310 [candidate division WWE3 bacterium RIFCSPHIGHO2_01_FULL_42_13]|uniref:AAA+ ATPase domain-containing protein n=1 Tax=candidate division WWE3 bacterium RIFCSPHIGHO2_01_FULL_42_13 TaxID=1802617 RepID=A0A1F4URJ3_UNCKA|nr:MAG: hypothetical protein A2886_02310 [candidate division WWE3 bacterium RIFCSPHIGHO2_01_FULL_42_13]